MKNNISCLLILCGLLFFTSELLAADNNSSETLETGHFLFIKSAEPYEVYVNGELHGSSPCLLTDVPYGISTLELKGEKLYARKDLSFNDGIKSITSYVPEMSPFYGYLEIRSATPGLSIIIDGERQPLLIGKATKFPAGDFTVQAAAEGYFTENVNIKVPRLDNLSVEINLERAYQIVFSAELPADTVITFIGLDNGKEVIYSPDRKIELPAGAWKCVLKSAMFPEYDCVFSISETDKQNLIEINPRYYSPQLTFAGLKKGSLIKLDGKEIEYSGGGLASTAGKHILTVELTNYLPFIQELNLSSNKVTEIPIVYAKDPEFIKKSNMTTSFIIAGSGLAIIASGLVLNMDDIAVAITPDYETYSTMKYVSLGVAGAGVLTVAGGVLFGILTYKP